MQMHSYYLQKLFTLLGETATVWLFEAISGCFTGLTVDDIFSFFVLLSLSTLFVEELETEDMDVSFIICGVIEEICWTEFSYANNI